MNNRLVMLDFACLAQGMSTLDSVSISPMRSAVRAKGETCGRSCETSSTFGPLEEALA